MKLYKKINHKNRRIIKNNKMMMSQAFIKRLKKSVKSKPHHNFFKQQKNMKNLQRKQNLKKIKLFPNLKSKE